MKQSERRPRQKISGDWVEVRSSGLVSIGGVVARAYGLKALRVLITDEPGIGLHLSISHPGRYPTWDEIAHARYSLLPDDKTFVMFLPPSDQYVNVEGGPRGGNVFHLHEYRDGE
ncbi:MAG: hypothetical protein WC211_03740 [Dehalococcoidia bacterium]